jgi:hypothetical protein
LLESEESLSSKEEADKEAVPSSSIDCWCSSFSFTSTKESRCAHTIPPTDDTIRCRNVEAFMTDRRVEKITGS